MTSSSELEMKRRGLRRVISVPRPDTFRLAWVASFNPGTCSPYPKLSKVSKKVSGCEKSFDFFRFGGGFGRVLETMLGAILGKISIIWPLFNKLLEITKIKEITVVYAREALTYYTISLVQYVENLHY